MWIDELLSKINRTRIPVAYDPHLIIRESHRNLDLRLIKETVRTGKVDSRKSNPPRKICFNRYFGKQNQTYTVISIIHDHYVEVKTAWIRKGR